MALKPLNSVGGFSVGEVPANIILANGDITASNATFSGNLLISNATASWGVKTDNLYYSNGTPWDFQQAAGANGELQFNMGDDFAASPNLTFDNTTQLFTVTGNANITGTLTAGALNVDEIFNGNSNVAIPAANGNVNISVSGNANVLVVTGTGANVTGTMNVSGNLDAGNLRTANGYVESTSGAAGLYLVPGSSAQGIVGYGKFTPNANVSHDLGSSTNNWANLYANNAILAANITSGNANLGNLAVANYVNVSNQLNVIDGIFAGNLQINVAANISNIAVANFVASNLTPTSDDQYSLGTTSKRWKDINIAGNANIAVANVSGNISAGNISFGNLLTGNYGNFTNDLVVQGNIANANNISVTNALQANTGNFSGNIQALNANLGNLATANYMNIAQNVDINGSLDATNANFVGNIAISNSNPAYGILTDNLYYANGQPWDLQEAAGSNNEIQFNSNDNFAASANFTFDPTTDTLTVTGNANVTGAVNTANINSGTSNLNLIANGFSTVLDDTGNATFPGNVTAHTFYGNVNANITITAPNTTILFSDAGLVDGSNAFTFNKNSNLVSITGNVELGLAGDNQLVNLSNTALEIRGGWDSNAGAVNIVAGDYSNSTLWGKLSIQGNVGGNAVGYSEANAFVFTTPGAGAGNVVKVDTLNTSAANTTSGALQVTGGLGVTGNGYFGNLSVTGDIANANNISVTNTLNAVTGNFSGNINSLNANLGNLVEANFVNVASNVTTSNLTVNTEISGNTANFSGNVVLPNLQVNSELSGNTANFIGNVTLSGPNVTVSYDLVGNTANFSGNIKSLNANLGNLVEANFVNVASNIHTVNANVTGTLEVANANISSNLTVNNLTVNLDLSGNTANFTGNVVLSGANVTVNNHLSGNTANFSGNITSLNANLGNLVDANFIRTGELMNGNSNIIIAPNGNISLSATGTSNVFVLSNVGANITGYVTANGDGTFGAVKSNSVTAQGGNLTLYAAAGDNYVELRPTGNGHVDVANHRIENLATPVASTDAATKGYVDAAVEGLHVHAPCVAATPDTLANISSGTVSYNNGSSGVGANLVTTGSYTLIDGVNIATVGTRILVKDEANAAWNGIYTYANSTTLVRATDYDTPTEMAGGDFTFVQQGTIYNDTGWVMTDPVLVVGTDPVNWLQFSGAGEYTAGAGLTLTGTVFSVNVDNVTTEIAGGNVVVKANAQLTTPNIGAATGTSLDLTGNLLAGNVNSNALVSAANVNVTANVLAGNLTANANLLVNNATVNLELSGNTANFSGNVIVPNLTVNTTLSGNVANFSGNITSLNANLGNLATANYVNIAANLHTSNANITGTLDVANVNISSNLTVNNLSVNLELAGNTANFTGNVILPNVQVNLELAGNTANFSGNVVAANVTANATVFAANANISGNTITNELTVNNAIAGNTANFSGNVVVNNLTTNLELAGNTANFSGNVILPNLTVNLELVGNTANFSGNVVTNNLVANGVANVGNLNVAGNVTSDLLPNANLTLDLGIATQRWDNVYAGNIDASGNLTIAGNLQSNNYTANVITANTQINVGNSEIHWGEVVTTAITANQTISTVTVTGVTGIEWIVKGIDSSGAKYSMAMVTAVTDGTSVDYSQFGGVNLGSTTGTLAVNVVGSNVELQVTPSSSNSTTWVTQYRTI